MTFLYILGIAILAAVCFNIWKQSQGSDSKRMNKLQAEKEELVRMATELKVNLEMKSEELGKARKELEMEKSEKSEQQGKGKQQYAQNEQLKAKMTTLEQERDELRDRIAAFESEAKRRDKEHDARILSLEKMEKSFQEEKQRVTRQEEERLKQEAEERDRLWNDHELAVIASMGDLCKQPQFSFTNYSNTNLPEGFDGSLKPDFMIEFLGQYVIFDAKVSKAESLQTYINDAVKKTAEKIKKNPNIFPIVFLVVPTQALSELKKFHYPKDDYTFFVIGTESLAPVLFSLKRITTYELAEQMDPQKRENIINLIAELDFHVNLRNSADLVLTKMGMNILDKTHRLDPELSAEVETKKQEKIKNIPQIVNAAFKKMVASAEAQQNEIEQVVAPKASIQRKDLDQAKEVLIDSLS